MKSRLISLFLVFLASMITSCKGQENNVRELPATEFAEMIKSNPNAQLLDVRTGEEYDKGHIKNALNIDWYDSTFEQQLAKLDKSKPVLVYCLAGKRSAAAAQKMRGVGFSEVIGLKGGMMEWRAANLPEEGSSVSGDQGLTKEQFDLFLNTDKLVLVDFYADWCQPCQKMKPYLEEISKEMGDRVIVVRINADDNRGLCKNLEVSALPVLQLYRSKKMVWSYNGYISKEDVVVQLNKN